MSEHKEPGQTVVVWFEIPATDFDRAAGFYERLLDVKLRQEMVGPAQMGVFPYAAPSVSGAVIKGDLYTPGRAGPVVYLNCDGKLDATLARVEAAGGKIALARTDLPPGMGSFAHIVDTEGNRVGLHTSV